MWSKCPEHHDGESPAVFHLCVSERERMRERGRERLPPKTLPNKRVRKYTVLDAF